MNTPKITWRTAKPAANTAVFAIGDIHANAAMLATLLSRIDEKMAEIHQAQPSKKIHLIGIGDYIDRGEDAPQTIDLLGAFEKQVKEKYGAEVHYLCGNHDEYFHRLLQATSIKKYGDVQNLGQVNTFTQRTREDGGLSYEGMVEWMNSGGGITTLKQYLPKLDDGLITRAKNLSNELEMNDILRQLKQAVPQSHKAFFAASYAQDHFRLGDFMFTHAGIDPDHTLAEQQLESLSPLEKSKAVNRRNEFLWRDSIAEDSMVIVHGHTPSEILGRPPQDQPTKHEPMRVVDPQKNYRLCIDTGVYHPNGALTCMLHDGEKLSFLAVAKQDPDFATEYSIAPRGAELAAEYHHTHFPQYHTGTMR